MTPEQFRQVEALFHRGKDLPPAEQRALLDSKCGDDPEVREEVEELLAHHKEQNLQRLGAMRKAETMPANRAPGRPQRIGRYRILERLGEGGMGTVYLAEQDKPIQRRVALKVIKRGMDTGQVIARFEVERQALAVMDHPNVAKVLDAGTTEDGLPYFVMEHVAGVRITEHCDRHNLGIAARLDLFMQVCDAVQHAHQKGIIHRDLKPSNILVSVKDARGASASDRSGVPKVIDFGVAKALSQRLTERTLFTEQGQLIGTPEYMSPEQAEMTAQDIDTRSDIYSLGVLLYELLTGSLPFDSKTLRRAGVAEVARIIREQDPPKPSTRLSTPTPTPTKGEGRGKGSSTAEIARHRQTEPKALVRALRGDLDWIVMMALEKDRTRRYETANGLAADLRRHLNHEPVVASPPSIAYRTQKFIRRNRGLVIAAMVVFLVLVAGIISTGIALSGEAEQRELAEQREKEANVARTETQKRADELQIITTFQQSMLSKIDVEEAGLALFADLRARVRESLEAEEVSPEDIESALAAFNQTLRRANATDAALTLIDEQVLSRAVEAIKRQFADQPLVRAALQQTVASTYSEIGRYPPALPLQEAALETRRTELGDDHPDTLESIYNMGRLLMSMGKLAEAEPYLREALVSIRRVLGDDHPNTLTSINNMGGLLQSMGKLAEAEAYFREALEGRRRALGDDHLETLNSISSMGSLLKSLGKLAEAEAYFRAALEGQRRVLGKDHPSTLSSINSMGALLQEQGKLAEAEPYYREALEGRHRVLGDEHPDTLVSINNMGALLHALGKLAEAEPHLREALEGSRLVLGDDHPNTLSFINNMGALLHALGKLAEAEPYLREALERSRRALGDDHPKTLVSIHNMGTLLLALGKLAETEPHLREALERSRRVLGDDHPNTLTSINSMGALLQEQGKLADAEPYYREALERSRRVLGDDHPNTLKTIHSMGRLMRDLGQLEQAEALGAEAVRGARATLAPSHPFRLAALAAHGRTLAAMQRFPDAEAELLEAYEGWIKSRGEEHRRTIDAAKALADLYEAWHAAKPEKGYDAKAAEWRAKLPAATSQPARTTRPTSQANLANPATSEEKAEP